MRTLTLIVFVFVFLSFLSFANTAEARNKDPWGDLFRDIAEEAGEAVVDDWEKSRRDNRRAEERKERDNRRAEERREREERKHRQELEEERAEHERKMRELREKYRAEFEEEEAELERDIRRDRAEAEIKDDAERKKLERELEEEVRKAEVRVYREYSGSVVNRGETPLTFEEWRNERRANETLRRHGYGVPESAQRNGTDPGKVAPSGSTQVEQLEARLTGLEQGNLRKEKAELEAELEARVRHLERLSELLKGELPESDREALQSQVDSVKKKVVELDRQIAEINGKLKSE